jgi:hypothetical protein
MASVRVNPMQRRSKAGDLMIKKSKSSIVELVEMFRRITRGSKRIPFGFSL